MNRTLAISAALVFSAPVFAVQSVKLLGDIDQGFGSINVMQKHTGSKLVGDISGAMLQSYREQHSNKLVFAVDVNEAANGSEKSETQGLAVESVSLKLTFASGIITCTDFNTNTASLLARAGSTQRQSYYTLIGATGSNLITPSTDSDLLGSDFSAVIRVLLDESSCSQPVPDLSTVQSAFLDITLLDTNWKLGDPEAFYDYSNGPEDVAVINLNDANLLTYLQPGSADAPLVIAQEQAAQSVESWLYYPTNESFYVVSYEDRYPSRGDYDFNDLVIGYRVGLGLQFNEITQQNEVVSLIATGYMIARGAEYSHDWYLHIPTFSNVTGTVTTNLFNANSTSQVNGYPKQATVSNEVIVQVLQDSKQLFQVSGTPFVNTEATMALEYGKKFSFTVNLDQPLSLSNLGLPPYDPFLLVRNTNQEIHLPGLSPKITSSQNYYGGSAFRDASGYPFALVFPDDWYPPLEGTDIGLAYPSFVNYTQNPNPANESWYLSPDNGKTKNIGKAFWKW